MITFKEADEVLVLDNLRDFVDNKKVKGYYYDNSVTKGMLNNINKVFTVIEDYTYSKSDTGVKLKGGFEYPPISLQLITENKHQIELIL